MILGFDLETTGLDFAAGHKIIELAAIVYDDAGNERGAFTQRYNPQRPIDPKAQAVHGITFEDLATCPLFGRDAAKLSAMMQRATLIVAHNGRTFDYPFINHEFRQAGVNCIDVPLVDTCELGRWATPWGKLPSLKEMAFAMGVEYDEAQAHGATYDVRVMMECYFRAARKGFFPTPQALAA